MLKEMPRGNKKPGREFQFSGKDLRDLEECGKLIGESDLQKIFERVIDEHIANRA